MRRSCLTHLLMSALHDEHALRSYHCPGYATPARQWAFRRATCLSTTQLSSAPAHVSEYDRVKSSVNAILPRKGNLGEQRERLNYLSNCTSS